MSLVNSYKNGAIGIVGQCILGVYFIIGTTCRLLTLTMIYIAHFGLFGHIDPATRSYDLEVEFHVDRWSASAESWRAEFENVSGQDGLDVDCHSHLDNFSCTFHLRIPFSVTFVGTVAPIALHFLGAFSAQCYLYKDCKDTPKRLQHALWTLICPPLFLDWEGVFRESGFAAPVGECWRRSTRFFVACCALNSAETLLLGLLALTGRQRLADARALIESFVFLVDAGEDQYFRTENLDSFQSMEKFERVYNVCFGAVIAFATATPAVMGGLAYIYFAVKGHPWVRILREGLRSEEDVYAVRYGGRKKVYHIDMAEHANMHVL